MTPAERALLHDLGRAGGRLPLGLVAELAGALVARGLVEVDEGYSVLRARTAPELVLTAAGWRLHGRAVAA